MTHFNLPAFIPFHLKTYLKLYFHLHKICPVKKKLVYFFIGKENQLVAGSNNRKKITI